MRRDSTLWGAIDQFHADPRVAAAPLSSRVGTWFAIEDLPGARGHESVEALREIAEETEMGEGRVVRDVMSREVATLGGNDQLSIADDVMRLGRIRHLPVVDDDGRLEGVVSQRDLFRGALARSLGYGDHAHSKLMSMLRVKEIMTTQVETIRAEVSLSEAARRMIDRKIGCLVVVDEASRPEGILTEADFVKLALES